MGRQYCVGRSWMAGDWLDDCTSIASVFGRLPVPAGGDLARGPFGTCGMCCPTGTLRSCSAERGIAVITSLLSVGARFTPEFIEAARPCRHAPGDRWFADETYVKVAGRMDLSYRAVNQHGQVIDVLRTSSSRPPESSPAPPSTWRQHRTPGTGQPHDRPAAAHQCPHCQRAISKYNARGPGIDRRTYQATLTISILTGQALTASPDP